MSTWSRKADTSFGLSIRRVLAHQAYLLLSFFLCYVSVFCAQQFSRYGLPCYRRGRAMLCRYCAELDFTAVHSSPQRLQSNLEALRVSGRDCCSFCLYLSDVITAWHDVRGGKYSPTLELDSETPLLLEIESDRDFIAGFRVLGLSGHPAPRVNIFLRRDDPPSCFSEKFFYRDIAPDTSSAACFDLCKSWLQTCSTKHANCFSSSKGYRMPKRLLDLSPPGEVGLVRLIEGEGLKAPYLTLSYSWGSSKITSLKLSLRNFSLFTAGISEAQLPRVFRDAARITRELKHRYLWIDALCIIQDSPLEKSDEVKNMDSIFQNSVLTIAAAASPHCAEGILIARGNSGIRETYLDWKEFDGLSGFPGGIRFRHSPSEPAPWSRCQNLDGPLITRGWVLQEQVLSTRVLYFTSRQLEWECRCLRWSECHDIESYADSPSLMSNNHSKGRSSISLNLSLLPNLLRFYKDNPGSSSKKTQISAGTQNPLIERLFETWYHLLSEFSFRNLSDTRDKLSAIQGLVSMVIRHTKDYYLFGIWKSDIHRGLMWTRAVQTFESDDSRSGLIVPSWTWAVFNDGILNLCQSSPDSRWLNTDFDYEHVSKIDFSDARAGKLNISGLCRYGRICWFQGRPEMIKFKGQDVPKGKLSLDIVETPRFAGPRGSRLSPFDDKQLLCIQIARFKFPGLTAKTIGGLVLGQTGFEGHYVRVGVFRLQFKEDLPNPYLETEELIDSYLELPLSDEERTGVMYGNTDEEGRGPFYGFDPYGDTSTGWEWRQVSVI